MKYYVTMTPVHLLRFKDILNNGLISYGSTIKDGKGWNFFSLDKTIFNHLKTYEKNDQRCIVDSGGFQVFKGYVRERRLNEYIQSYTMSLNKIANGNFKTIDAVFTLDVFPPYLNEDDKILSYNIRSLNTHPLEELHEIGIDTKMVINASKLELFHEIIEESRWLERLKENNILPSFAIGGIVGSKKRNGYNTYIPAMLWLIDFLGSKGITEFKLHLLGMSTNATIIGSNYIRGLSKNNIHITLDSSTPTIPSRFNNIYPIFKNTEGDVWNKKCPHPKDNPSIHILEHSAATQRVRIEGIINTIGLAVKTKPDIETILEAFKNGKTGIIAEELGIIDEMKDLTHKEIEGIEIK